MALQFSIVSSIMFVCIEDSLSVNQVVLLPQAAMYILNNVHTGIGSCSSSKNDSFYGECYRNKILFCIEAVTTP